MVGGVSAGDGAYIFIVGVLDRCIIECQGLDGTSLPNLGAIFLL